MADYVGDDGIMRPYTTKLTIPKPIWEWDLFGQRQMVVTMTDTLPQPTWYQRLMTKILFGSTWTKL